MGKKANAKAAVSSKSAVRKLPVHKSCGANTGLGICAFFATIFEANEELPQKKRRSDEAIAAEVELEFPSRKTGIGKGKRYSVNVYRGYYNSGKLTGGIPPIVPSFRYSKDGVPVDRRTGRRVLDKDEITFYKNQQKRLRSLTLNSKFGKSA